MAIAGALIQEDVVHTSHDRKQSGHRGRRIPPAVLLFRLPQRKPRQKTQFHLDLHPYYLYNTVINCISSIVQYTKRGVSGHAFLLRLPPGGRKPHLPADHPLSRAGHRGRNHPGRRRASLPTGALRPTGGQPQHRAEGLPYAGGGGAHHLPLGGQERIYPGRGGCGRRPHPPDGAGGRRPGPLPAADGLTRPEAEALIDRLWDSPELEEEKP